MKRVLLILLLLSVHFSSTAQKVDSIFFHLYTDSLKKGTNNYINVDGKMSNGSWRPLTAKEIEFSASACSFSGNELMIPSNFIDEKITVKAVLKSNPLIWIEKTLWIKRKPDPEVLPTKEEIMRKPKHKNR